MRILSVDIGIRNFAWSVYCTDLRRFVEFRVIDLGAVKDYVARMRALTLEEPFVSSDVILVENQMRACMKTMATAIRCFHYDKTLAVAPQRIKRFFRTSMRAHRKNKLAGVCEARRYLCPEMLVRFESFKKKDDVADCILQTVWYTSKVLKAKAA